jgi:hypothetical protein
MKNGNWHFTVKSREYGLEEYVPYDRERDAMKGIEQIKRKARKLNDNVQRDYSKPYKK